MVIITMGYGKMEPYMVRENQFIVNKLLMVNLYKENLMGNVQLLLWAVLLIKHNS